MIDVSNVNKWEEFDVSSALASWIEDSQLNRGLQIICDTQAINDVITFTSASDEDSDAAHLPQVDIETQQVPASRSRRRRDVIRDDCVRGGGQSECCRYPLYINFRDIGWQNWVLAPLGFQAFFCDGQCSTSAKFGTRFASVQAKLHASNPLAAPAPCCGASKLAPLKLLVRTDDNRAERVTLEDMVVEECRCF